MNDYFDIFCSEEAANADNSADYNASYGKTKSELILHMASRNKAQYLRKIEDEYNKTYPQVE